MLFGSFDNGKPTVPPEAAGIKQRAARRVRSSTRCDAATESSGYCLEVVYGPDEECELAAAEL